MYLVKFTNMEVTEFNAVDFEDLMLLIVEYIGENKQYFDKAISGFKNDYDKESQYVKLFNKLYGFSSELITNIYEIKDKWEF